MQDTAPIVHHYTDIPTLALILSTKKLRFTRLDGVSDLAETKVEKGIDFGKLFFVSCWTSNKEESIPLWRMYTPGMRGVRISLRSDMFLKHEYVVPAELHGGKPSRPVPSPISFGEAFADDHMILTTFLNPQSFGGSVRYVDDVEQAYQEAVQVNWKTPPEFEVEIADLCKLPRLKSRPWAFEDEFRFSLCILPSLPLATHRSTDPEYAKQFANHVGTCLVKGVGVSFTHKDLDLDLAALRSMEITLGPCCTKGDRVLVESLVNSFAKGAELKVSSLSGTIRAG